MSPLGNSNLHPKPSEELGLSSVVECMLSMLSVNTHTWARACVHAHTHRPPTSSFIHPLSAPLLSS